MRDRLSRGIPARAVPPTLSQALPVSSRRDFLFALGITGACAAVTSSASLGAAGVTPAPQTGSRGYQETDHVRSYYDSARL